MRGMLEKRVTCAGSRRSKLFVAMALVASLAALSVAAPALAMKEKEPAPGPFKRFSNCPFNYTGPFAEGEPGPEENGEWSGLKACVVAKSAGSEMIKKGSEIVTVDSEFEAGNVTVHLTKPIIVRGGFSEDEELPIEEAEQFLGAEDTPTLKPVAQPAPSLTELPIEEAALPPAERTRYKKALETGKTKVTATVELAGEPTAIKLSERNLLAGEGVALGLPVKVKLTNGFLGKSCYVGSNESPIQINLTTGTSGAVSGNPGELIGINQGAILEVVNDELVDNTYAAPGVTGCGFEPGAIDAALNGALGLPSAAGKNRAVITGTLWQTSRRQAELYGHL
jgi:hypothetical protein